jgi:hypothetical protein
LLQNSIVYLPDRQYGLVVTSQSTTIQIKITVPSQTSHACPLDESRHASAFEEDEIRDIALLG